MVAVKPQRIADDRKWFSRILVLLVKHPPQNRFNAERREHACGQPSGSNFRRLSTKRSVARKFKVSRRGGPHGGEGARRFAVGCNLNRGDADAGAISQVISQQHKPVCILERQGSEQNALYQRKDCSRSPKAKSKRENDRQTEGWRLAQAAHCESKVMEKRKHVSFGSN